MADNLPLIPSKRGDGDVRTVLRAVFRDRCARLPPLGPGSAGGAGAGGAVRRREADLREKRARRLARAAPPHQYTLHAPPAAESPAHSTSQHIEPLSYSNLMPGIDQNAVRNEALWVRNVLARSSGDVSALELQGMQMLPSLASPLPFSECRSAQTMSVGEAGVLVTPPSTPLPPKVEPPEYVMCVPPSLDFVNFTLGRLHTHVVRIVNISATEVRLALRPPARRELDVELRGRLQVTSGATTEVRVHFRPRDVRALHDELCVRVSHGSSLRVPIACYMEPPLLEVLVPNLTRSALSCVVEEVTGPWAEGSGEEAGDVVDLGARLLGDTHCAALLLRCHNPHVSFFIITEDSWLTHSLEEVTSTGAAVSGVFAWQPAWWRGGGALRGAAWCRAPAVGLHCVVLRVLSSTAVDRPLYLLADSLYFHHRHITLQAHEKDYDICSEDDAQCEYYVHLGTAFPRRALAATVLLVNHSPVSYSYYWSVRPWGECSCWQDELRAGDWLSAEDDPERLCVGAREARAMHSSKAGASTEAGLAVDTGTGDAGAAGDAGPGGKAGEERREERREEGREELAALCVEPAQGAVAARASVALHVALPDVGQRLGTRRAVLMLVLRDIPRDSFPPGYTPMVISSNTVPIEHISGFQDGSRELCEVVCCQMEVWWHVAPLRFALEPAMVALPHSRRVSGVELSLRATQLYYGGSAVAAFSGAPAAAPLRLTVGLPTVTTIHLPLPYVPNEFPVKSTITLEEEHGEWSSQCVVERECATRSPALRPHGLWLGLVPPGAPMRAHLTLFNDTHQDIYWWADACRWWGENPPKEVCRQRVPCEQCCERQCTCSLLRPARGGLALGHQATLHYAVNAPSKDGCVVTVVRARRCGGDVARLPPAPAAAARAAVLAYRVLAPKLALQVLPCGGDPEICAGCELSGSGGAVVRAARALVVGRRSCCRLRVRNLTPLATRVFWEPPLEENHLRIVLIPNEFDVDGHSEVEIRVVVEARAVCARRVFLRRAAVRHATVPLYLLVDAAVAGVEVEIWLPLLDCSFCLRRFQREEPPGAAPPPSAAPQAFAWEDGKRAALHSHICQCKSTTEWVPPPPRPPKYIWDNPSVEIVWSAPALTRVCACWQSARPLMPLPQPLALQMLQIPLKTVRTLRVRMRSACVLTARWSAVARLGAQPARRTLSSEMWDSRVLASGVCVCVSPARGTLGARARQDLQLRAYADTWGLYHDQIVILMEHLEPLVLDLWLEVVGCPLQFLASANTGAPHTLWISEQDPVRTIRARNTSRAPLTVYPYLLKDHGNPKDAYPFRVCIRFFDVLPRVCPCCHAHYHDDSAATAGSFPGESCSHSTLLSEEMDTGVELYLAPDHGVQCSEFFQVEPWECSVAPGEAAEWRVAVAVRSLDRSAPLAPDHTLLLRMIPTQPRGPAWFRPEPAAAAAHLRTVLRVGRLQLSHDVIVAKLSALALPFNEVLRVRKRIRAQNVGDGHLSLTARVIDGVEGRQLGDGADSVLRALADGLLTAESEGPRWRLLQGEARAGGACGAGCGGQLRAHRQDLLDLRLPPKSSTEICAELRVRTADVWPTPCEWGEESLAAHSLLTLRVASSGGGGAGAGGGAAHSALDAPAAPPPPRAPYEPCRIYTSHLQFYDDVNVLQTVGLVLELEQPALRAQPAELDFGFVCDGDTRKSYFSLSHSSRTETISVHVSWAGSAGFRLTPTRLVLAPGAQENVYLQYSARWTGAVCEGWAVARATGAAGAWCAAAVHAHARTSRDFKCHLPPHDHTDEPHMLPPLLSLIIHPSHPTPL